MITRYILQCLTRCHAACYNNRVLTQPLVLSLLGLALLFPSSLLAGTVSISQPIKDPAGRLFNGSVVFKLNAAGNTSSSAIINTPTTPLRITDGQFNIPSSSALPTLVGNDLIQPANTTYTAMFYNTSGRMVVSRPYYVVDATGLDLATAVPTSFTTYNISYLNPATVNGNNTFTGTNIFTVLLSANGGFKAGASGSTVTDTRELLQSVHNCGNTTTCANTPNNSYRMILGAVTMTAGTATVSGISPAFTSQFTIGCVAMDQTSGAAVKAIAASSSSITVTGTGGDQIYYVCIGD